jgi:hypothetical protein
VNSTGKSLYTNPLFIIDEAVLLYSEYAKSAGFTLTTERIKQITNDIHRIRGENMKAYIGEETKKNPFIEILDKRTFDAYRFTALRILNKVILPHHMSLQLFYQLKIIY